MLLKKVKANTKVEIGNCISDNRISDRAVFFIFRQYFLYFRSSEISINKLLYTEKIKSPQLINTFIIST